MLEAANQHLLAFISGPDYWFYHGWGLTICWVLLAFFGILIRKLLRGTWSKYIHIFFFILVDYTACFLELTALYRVWPRIANGTFMEWSLLKNLHVFLGLVSCAWTIYQHLVGVALHYLGKFKWAHITSGKLLFILSRIVVVLGWLITKNYTVAAVTTVAILATFAILKAVKKQEKVKAS